MHYVYILRSLKDGRLYTGSTGDVAERVASHNRGATPSTRKRRPFELVYVEECAAKASALARERQLKSLGGGPEKFRLVEQAAGGVVEMRKRYLGGI
ncbi:MAG: GIY-YIG nuclease family protein [Dehalococcoidia bacterium]|nr:GIY-YIG nuclease family protein [Dehalococcoidia bacterium]